MLLKLKALNILKCAISKNFIFYWRSWPNLEYFEGIQKWCALLISAINT